MKLKNIDEIKEDGLVVFMPSGIQATLFNEDNNIIVKYYDLAEDKYSKEDFKSLIDEGIFIFNERPTTQVMENLHEKLQDEDIYNCLSDYADNEGVNIADLEEYDPQEIAEWISDELGEEITAEKIEQLIQDEIADMEDSYDDEEEIDESVLDKLTKKGYIRKSLKEAFEQKDNKPGNVYTALKDKEKEYLTADYKLELLQDLDKIAKEYPNVHVRQQAQTFIDELGIQEYYDIKKVQQFIDKHIDIMNPTNESLNETVDVYGLKSVLDNYECSYVTDLEKDGNLFTAWFIHEKNAKGQTGKQIKDADVYYQIANAIERKFGEKAQVVTRQYKYAPEQVECMLLLPITGAKEFNNLKPGDKFEMEGYDGVCEVVEKTEDGNWECKAPTGDDYTYFDLEVEDMDKITLLNESLKEELGEYANNPDLQEIAQQIKDGNKSGQSSEFGAWILNTSLDEKWNALTQNAQDYILEHISYPIYDGHIKYTDLELNLHEGSGLDFEDLASLKLFDDEQIGKILDNIEQTAYITYELAFEKTPNLEESFKVRKKKKKKIEDSLQEGIYLKDEDGNEIGPFKDTNAKDEFLKQQKEHGEEKEYEEIIKDEDMKNEAMNAMDQNIKTWYLGKYPKDELGKELNDVTFNELEKRMRSGEDVYDILGVGDSIVRERVFDFANRYGNKNLYDLWLSMTRIKSKHIVHEDCYKVYNNLEPDAHAICFNNWNEVEDHLQQQWGQYKACMAKENTEFGTEQDKEDYLNNFEVAIEPIEVPVDEIPAEGIELQVADVCPQCNEDPCVCEQPEVTEEPIVIEHPEEPVDPVEPLKEPAEVIKQQPEEPEMEDDLDYIENYIQSLLDKAEDNDLNEMCMQKLPVPEKAKEQNKKAAEEKEEKEQKQKEKNEDFSDNMGMLTDINDLDFPDALHDAVDTKEDGSLYRLSDLAKELQDVKSSIEQIKNDFKSELTTMIQDLKNDLKIEVNNVETKVQDTKSAVDNLTSEEEDLDMEEPPVEEQPQEPAEKEEPAENEEPGENEEQVEEAYDEESLKGNALFEDIKEIIATNKHPKKMISIQTIAQRLREEYGVNANINTQAGQQVYKQVANLVNKTSLRECVVDPRIEEAERKKSILGKAASWLKGGLMESMAKQKQAQLDENLAQIKAEIDKKVQAGANAEDLNNEITLSAENEQEAKDAKQYAISKLNDAAKTENLKSKLLGTSRSSVFSEMDLRG